MSDVNIPLLRKCVEWVENEASKPAIDRRWWQNRYLTPPRVLAGWLLQYQPGVNILNEYELLDQVETHCGTAFCVAGYVGQLYEERYQFEDCPDGLGHVSEFAQKKLGLTSEQAQKLFAGENSVHDIRRIAEQFAGEPL